MVRGKFFKYPNQVSRRDAEERLEKAFEHGSNLIYTDFHGSKRPRALTLKAFAFLRLSFELSV
jgi:hypothetical protein